LQKVKTEQTCVNETTWRAEGNERIPKNEIRYKDNLMDEKKEKTFIVYKDPVIAISSSAGNRFIKAAALPCIIRMEMCCLECRVNTSSFCACLELMYFESLLIVVIA